MEGETINQPPQVPTEQMKKPTVSTFGQHDHESPKHLGLVLGILVVVLVAIAGGLYLWWSGVFGGDAYDESGGGASSVVVPPEVGGER